MSKFTATENVQAREVALNLAMNQTLATANLLIEDVQAKVDSLNARFNEGDAKINWGHVGDLNYIISQLRNALGQE